jgi:hypothetical protein
MQNARQMQVTISMLQKMQEKEVSRIAKDWLHSEFKFREETYNAAVYSR